MAQAFIEAQFPVSKVSKESYKERKANNGQTLTGLGKWWGRKPLVLVRAAILGCLLPATDNPVKDHEIFLRLMSMDDEGLLARKDKRFSAKELYERITADKRLSRKYATHFTDNDGKISLNRDAPRDEIEEAVFGTLGYDRKIAMCKRPEQLENLSESAWAEINAHLDTDAHSLPELVRQLSVKRFGHNFTVGDCFCGGGSIPFEAARIGCDVYASDLNPIAGLLTWADLHICGASETELQEIRGFQKAVYDAVDKEIRDLKIETNEKGDRAVSYLYCTEARCPECGQLVPLAPSWVIGKGTKTVAILKENGERYDIGRRARHVDGAGNALSALRHDHADFGFAAQPDGRGRERGLRSAGVGKAGLRAPRGRRLSGAALRNQIRAYRHSAKRQCKNDPLLPRPDCAGLGKRTESDCDCRGFYRGLARAGADSVRKN